MWKRIFTIAGIVVFVELCFMVNLGDKHHTMKSKLSSKTRLFKTTTAPSQRPKLHWKVTCRRPKFASPPLPVTVLVSYPGSGNTWLRHLLQQGSGILTGSIYRDATLYENGFPGEGRRDGTVIVVKQHGPRMSHEPKAIRKYDRVLLLTRDPIYASAAEFNRRHSNHVGFAKDEQIIKDLPAFLYSYLKLWREIYLTWLQVNEPLLLVEYDKLKQNLREEMLRVFTFLNISVTEDDLDCMERNKEGIFHRKQKQLPKLNLTKEYLVKKEEAVAQVRTRYQTRQRQKQA